MQDDSKKIKVYTSFTTGGYVIGEESKIEDYMTLTDAPEGKNYQTLSSKIINNFLEVFPTTFTICSSVNLKFMLSSLHFFQLYKVC